MWKGSYFLQEISDERNGKKDDGSNKESSSFRRGTERDNNRIAEKTKSEDYFIKSLKGIPDF